MGPCTEVWRAALGHYLGRLNLLAPTGDLEPLRRLLGHLLDTDGERFLVATEPGEERLIAFVSATQRGPVWFLAMLFVEPEEQGAGLGRRLLEMTLPAAALSPSAPGLSPSAGPSASLSLQSASAVLQSASAVLPSASPASRASPTRRSRDRGPAAGTILATVTDSVQPVSNALYARFGIVPREPLFHLLGRPDDGEPMPALPAGIRPSPLERGEGPIAGSGADSAAAAIAAIDRSVLGYERPTDHDFLRRDGRLGFLYRAGDGQPVGYAYGSPSGRVGPVAVTDETLLPAVLGHVLDAIEPPDASALWIGGAAGGTLPALLRAGFRIDGFPALLCWSAPFAAFERYVPISLALL